MKIYVDELPKNCKVVKVEIKEIEYGKINP